MPTSSRHFPFGCRLHVAFFLLLLLTYGYFFQGGFANQNSRYDLALALVYEKQTSIDTFRANTIDFATYQDRYFSAQPPGGAILALPTAWITSQIASVGRFKSNHRVANIPR